MAVICCACGCWLERIENGIATPMLNISSNLKERRGGVDHDTPGTALREHTEGRSLAARMYMVTHGFTGAGLQRLVIWCRGGGRCTRMKLHDNAPVSRDAAQLPSRDKADLQMALVHNAKQEGNLNPNPSAQAFTRACPSICVEPPRRPMLCSVIMVVMNSDIFSKFCLNCGRHSCRL